MGAVSPGHCNGRRCSGRCWCVAQQGSRWKQARSLDDISGSVRGEAAGASSSSGRHRSAGVNHIGGGSSRSRATVLGNWGKRPRRLQAMSEENRSAGGPARKE
jgi:hypothetical protein